MNPQPPCSADGDPPETPESPALHALLRHSQTWVCYQLLPNTAPEHSSRTQLQNTALEHSSGTQLQHTALESSSEPQLQNTALEHTQLQDTALEHRNTAPGHSSEPQLHSGCCGTSSTRPARHRRALWVRWSSCPDAACFTRHHLHPSRHLLYRINASNICGQVCLPCNCANLTVTSNDFPLLSLSVHALTRLLGLNI